MDLREHALAVFVTAVVAGLLHLALVHRIEARGARVSSLCVVLGLALAIRIAFGSVVDHGLSDDFHRYLWEGRVVLAGENPYRHAPDDPELAELVDDDVWPNVTHRQVAAAYPPLALAVFALAEATPWPLPFLRVAFVFAELLTWYLLARLLVARGFDPARSLVFGFAPLVILEYAGSFHFDSLAIAVTVLAFLARAGGRNWLGAILIGVAALFKPHAIVLAPLLLRPDSFMRTGPRGRRVVLSGVTRMSLGTAVALAVVAIGYAPFASEGFPFSGLLRYASEWSYNAPFFPAVVATLEGARDFAFDFGITRWSFVGPIARALIASSPDRIARMLLLCAFFLCAIALTMSRFSAERAAAWILAGLLLFSPTVQPWYLTWFLPFVAFEPRPSRSPLLLWVALAPLGYHVIAYFREYGVWVESVGWRIAQYAPVLLWIGWRLSASSTFSLEEGAVGGGEDPRAGKSDASPTQ